jgi:ribose transport system permease protein
MNRAFLRSPAAIVGAMTILIVLVGSLAFPGFLTANYLVQQLQIASFLGVVALGALCVILLGHIDLSVPWTMTGAAIAATSAVGAGAAAGSSVLPSLAIPIGLLIGALVGLVNGIGVAVLRVPAMIWTLGINTVALGLCIFITGGFAPAGEASGLMRTLATGRTLAIPNAALLWCALCLAVLLLLHRTTLGRAAIAMGNGERAAFLAGIRTRGVLIAAFVFAGLCSATGGLLLAGYANQAYQNMGDPFLLPAIGAIVIGGTSIQGGSGSVLGMTLGVVFMTLLTSVLSVLQMQDAQRQIIYGAVILGTLIFYGRFRHQPA